MPRVPDVGLDTEPVHEPPRTRITERLEELRAAIAEYRARAIALHARLVELEQAGNDNVAILRRTLIASSVRIESVARLWDDAPDEWPDEPTLRP